MKNRVKNFINKARRSTLSYWKKRGLKIEDGCSFAQMPNFGSEPYLIEIGKNFRCSTGVKFVTHDGGMHVLRNLGYGEDLDLFGKIKIQDNVFLGMDVVVLPNVTIGENVVIGAKSLVTKDIPSNTVAVGIPAKPIKKIEDYYYENRDKVMNTKMMNNIEKEMAIRKKFKL